MVRADNAASVGFYEALGYGRDEMTVVSRRLHES
jgi:ribosomal protein S18 acetylase RimI-like enzyme